MGRSGRWQFREYLTATGQKTLTRRIPARAYAVANGKMQEILPELSSETTGSFNCKLFHFMRLTASLGFAAKYWSASVIFVCPVNRKTESAVFRIAAIT